MDSSEKKYGRKIQHPGDSEGFPGGRESIGISGILPDDPGGITCMHVSYCWKASQLAGLATYPSVLL